jgi:hypothetical protein
VSTSSAETALPVRCANHPKVETAVSCSSCGKPICPDCMVPAPVGIKCAGCARLPRSARVSLRPRRAAAAFGASFGIGSAIGVLLAFGGTTGLGFLSFILGWVVGLVIGRATLRASGHYRDSSSGWIAASGAAWAFLCPAVVVAIAGGGGARIGVQILGLLIAAFVAYREAS